MSEGHLRSDDCDRVTSLSTMDLSGLSLCKPFAAVHQRLRRFLVAHGIVRASWDHPRDGKRTARRPLGALSARRGQPDTAAAVEAPVSPNSQHACPFLTRLPPEIRFMIYEHVLEGHTFHLGSGAAPAASKKPWKRLRLRRKKKKTTTEILRDWSQPGPPPAGMLSLPLSCKKM